MGVDPKFNDPKFMEFVEGVSPRSHGNVQPVFLSEFFLILQILWEIYQILKKLGWFQGWFLKRQATSIMKSGKTRLQKEIALKGLLARQGGDLTKFSAVMLAFALLAPSLHAGIYIPPDHRVVPTSKPAPYQVIDGVKRHTGYIPDPTRYNRAEFRSFETGPFGAEEIPAEYDMRTKVHPNITELKIQDNGDCWMFGACTAWEFILGVVDGWDGHERVSRAAGVACSGMGGCGGGYSAMNWFVKGGTFLEKDYAYKYACARCDKGKLIDQGQHAKKAFFIRSPSGGKPTLQDLQRAMLTVGAVEFCGNARSLGRGGRVDNFGNGGSDHCYAGLGWLDGKAHGWLDTPYIIVGNSWPWGDKGYGYYPLAKGDGVTIKGSVINEVEGVDYKPICPVTADAGPEQNILLMPGLPTAVQIGTPSIKDRSYSWTPVGTLSSATIAQPIASPKKTTTYELTVKNTACGAEAKALVKIHVFSKVMKAAGVATMKEIL